MIQEHYGKFIRDDGDALLRAYVKNQAQQLSGSGQGDGYATGSVNESSSTVSSDFPRDFLPDVAKHAEDLASPMGFEPAQAA